MAAQQPEGVTPVARSPTRFARPAQTTLPARGVIDLTAQIQTPSDSCEPDEIEIEITPAMIEAGADALLESGLLSEQAEHLSAQPNGKHRLQSVAHAVLTAALLNGGPFPRNS